MGARSEYSQLLRSLSNSSFAPRTVSPRRAIGGRKAAHEDAPWLRQGLLHGTSERRNGRLKRHADVRQRVRLRGEKLAACASRR